MSILAFSDLHFGLKASYSSQLESGFVSSEEEALKAMAHIYNRASQDDIDIVFFGGDLTHTNHPTSLVVKQITDWVIQLDSLNKPVYFITGNHDLSNYSHSFDFITPLVTRGLVKNINIIDSEVASIQYNGRTVFFVPFVWGEATSKYTSVEKSIKDILTSNSIGVCILSHFQESSCVSGSESAMISKSTEKFDLDSISESSFEDVLLLLGHIHQYQSYSKANGIDVCYTGNPYYHDRTDCNKPKGFVTIDSDWKIKFEPIPNLIRFYKYVIPVNIDPESFFASQRFAPNSILYIENNINSESEVISDYAINNIASKYGVKVAEIRNQITNNDLNIVTQISSDRSHKIIFRKVVEDLHKENPFSDEKLQAIFSCGDELIDEVECK